VKRLGVITAASLGLLGAAVVTPAGAADVPAKAPAGTVAWTPCPPSDPLLGGLLQGLECGTPSVPLDHRDPREDRSGSR
jgi:hypothetical protein